MFHLEIDILSTCMGIKQKDLDKASPTIWPSLLYHQWYRLLRRLAGQEQEKSLDPWTRRKLIDPGSHQGHDLGLIKPEGVPN